MADLREVECATDIDRRSVRFLIDGRGETDCVTHCCVVAGLLDTLDVAVAALRNSWITWLPGLDPDMGNSIEAMRRDFCEMCGITLEQATDLGIFAENGQ